MKRQKLGKKIISAIMSCVVLFVLSYSTSTQAVEPVNADEVTVIDLADIAPAEEAYTQPRSFTRTYNLGLTGRYQIVMDDSNWFPKSKLTVSFSSSKGPTQIAVYAVDRNGKATSTKYISLGRVAPLFLDSQGYFQLYAKSISGYNRPVTLTVQLTP